MNIFRILGNALVFFLSSKQRQIIRKQKQIRKQKRGRAYLASPRQPTYLCSPPPQLAGPANWPSPPPPPPLSSSSSARRTSACPTRARGPGHLLLAASPWPSLVQPHTPWTSLTLSPRAPLLLWLSRTQPPNTPAAADEHHRGHRPPRASPMSSEEPPSPSASSTPTHSTAGAL